VSTTYRKSEANPYAVGRSRLAQSPLEPGDELQGTWTREALVKMDAAFCAAMRHAINLGLERWTQAAS
jgi:hypothetical protein